MQVSLGAAGRLPPDPASAACVGWVFQAQEHVLVARVFRRPLGESLRQPQPPPAQVRLQAQAAADLLELLPHGVDAGDGRHSAPVHPGQLLLLLLSEGTAPDWAAVF